ncbi:MAG: tetratricopeptide repeat protein [Actinomycetota bacterium]|nr:tetratricopeptide repeat protein [Actinomycetota bacterium]
MAHNSSENEKDFLLKSLDDLDSELAKGDLTEKDYAQLSRNYKRRLIKLTKQETRSIKESKLQNVKKTWFTVTFLVVLALISGIAIANSSGERTGSETITGSIRKSTVTKLQEAQQLLSDSDKWDEAISLYDEVLQDQPSNAEALTYRAWLRYRTGEDSDPQIRDWREVRILNPEFADAIVFLTIALSDESRFSEALIELQELQELEITSQLRSVLDSQGLIGKVYAESKYDLLQNFEQPSLNELEMNTRIALEAANYLLQSDKAQRSVSALKLFRAILEDNPANPEALSRQALLLAQTGDVALYQRALSQINFAVNQNPTNIEVLLTRAILISGTDSQTACGDLETVLEIIESETTQVPSQVSDQVDNLFSSLTCAE